MEVLFESLKLIIFVFLLMVFVDFLQIKFRPQIKKWLITKPVNQYVGASLLGSIPGCLDAFFIVSLYRRGLVGFGALVAVMLSTAGDEAFLMLAMVPEAALVIFGICAMLGIVGGFLADKVAKKVKLKRARPEKVKIHKREEVKHFLEEHVIGDILKKHIPRLFLWVFFTLLAIEILMQHFNLEAILPQNKLLLILLAALLGIIPESGPHLIFLTLFSQGLIPFSVLLVNTLSQDGHGLLPLLSYSVKDTVNVQIFTTTFALVVGLLLFLAGF